MNFLSVAFLKFVFIYTYVYVRTCVHGCVKCVQVSVWVKVDKALLGLGYRQL